MAAADALTLAEAVRRIIAHEGAPNGSTLAPAEPSAVLRTVHERLVEQFAPVIGSAGFDAIFNRTLKVKLAGLPPLAIPKDPSSRVRLAHFATWLQTQPAAPALAVAEGLVATFCHQLSTFIGEGLVLQLIRNAWPSALAATTQTAPEEKK